MHFFIILKINTNKYRKILITSSVLSKYKKFTFPILYNTKSKIFNESLLVNCDLNI